MFELVGRKRMPSMVRQAVGLLEDSHAYREQQQLDQHFAGAEPPSVYPSLR
jgi:hypothetical protein